MSNPTGGANRTLASSEVQGSLRQMLDELERHVSFLREEGVSVVRGTPRKPAANPPGPTRIGVGGASELQAIAREVAACRKCQLSAQRRQAVPGQGQLNPDILFVGEGPGEDEDRQGLAFVGRAGQLLTRLINRMGYAREQVFIANIVKCRPPQNRQPLPEEVAACLPYLKRQIAVLQPKVIVALGAVALEALIAPGIRISRIRGSWQAFGEIPLMPTYHPSYLLRNQGAMWDVWSDMQQVLKCLGRAAPAAPGKAR